MIRSVTLLAVAAVLVAADPVFVPMGYTTLGADGLPQNVVVALTKGEFSALVAAARRDPPAPDNLARVVVGTGTWNGVWRDLQWTFRGALPVANLGGAWGQVTFPVPGRVAGALADRPASVALVHPTDANRSAPGRSEAGLETGAPGTAAASTVVWRMVGGSLVVDLPPRFEATLVVTLDPLVAPSGQATALAFPAGGILAVDLPPGFVARVGEDRMTPFVLPTAGPVALTVEVPVATVDSGPLDLEQQIRLRHHGDRLEWTARVTVAGQRVAPGTVALIVPQGLEVVSVTGDGLVAWRQADGRLHLNWSGLTVTPRRVEVVGVVAGGNATSVQPVLGLPDARRSSGSVGVVATGPVRWTPVDGLLSSGGPLQRVTPAADERYRLAWSQGDPSALALTWTTPALALDVKQDGLLVAGPGRWRAELALTLGGSGLADHLTLAVPSPWRVASVAGADWQEIIPGRVVLRGIQALAPGTTLVVRCTASDPAAPTLPGISVVEGAQVGRTRWLLADTGPVRLAVDGPVAPEHLAAALADDLARAGLALGATEHRRQAVEPAAGSLPGLRLIPVESRAQITAAHYLVAGAGSGRWACRLTVRPDQGTLDRVRIRLPPGVRLTGHRGEGVGTWQDADGWLVAQFAAPLDRPTALDLELAADWNDTQGRDRLEFAALVTEPPLAADTVALAEDPEAGQLVRRPDGLEERPPVAVPMPLGVVSGLLTGRTWAAAGTPWKLTVERERLESGQGVDGVATLVDVHSLVDPDGRLVSRATWYVINRSRSALALDLPTGCTLWEVRVAGQPVRARSAANSSQVEIPVTPLRPGEAATRIQVCWTQAAGGEGLRPVLPALGGIRAMRALWRFTAPPGQHLQHEAGWDPVEAGDATGARVEVLADEVKRLKATNGDNAGVRARLGDQMQLIDQELADHLAVLERLGQDTGRWTAAGQPAQDYQQQLQKRNFSYNSLAQGNRQELQAKLGSLTTSAKVQRDRRGGLRLDGQPLAWASVAEVAPAGPGYGPRADLPAIPADHPADPAGLPAVPATRGATGPAPALIGVDLLPDQAGEELTLRADGLGTLPVLRLQTVPTGPGWWPGLLGCLAAVAGLGALVHTLRGGTPRRP